MSKIIPYKNIPLELRNERRWVLWKLETRADEKKPTKVPYQTNGKRADSTAPNTWSTFEDVWQVYYDDTEEVYSGVGFVLGAPYVGIDVDNTNQDANRIIAKEAIRTLQSYSEFSQSGNGIHIIAKGIVPAGGNRQGSVEVYGRDRYFVMTGNHVPNTPTEIRNVDLTEFHKKYILQSGAPHKMEMPKDASPSAKEFKILCDLWKKHGQNAKEEDIILEFFKKAEYREKWEKNRQYVVRSVRAAKSKVFGEVENKTAKLNTICFSNIQSKKVEWLWENKIPRGKLTMFFGNPDCGKTGVLCDILARFTNQTVFPDNTSINDDGHVLFMSAEDDPEDTLRPRLEAAGAVLNKIHYVKGIVEPNAKQSEREIALDRDLHMLEASLLQNPNIKIVAIDPISSYFGNADLNKEQNIRSVLGPIKKLAEKTKVTFLCVGHFNKRQDVGALHRAGGAVAMTGVARAVWLFMKDPEVDGQFLMLLGKGNLTRQRTGLKYTIASKDDSSIIIWQGADTRDADAVADTLKDPVERARTRAERFLRDIRVPMLATEIESLAASLGIKIRTLNDAKKELNIQSEKRGKNWWWMPLAENIKPMYDDGAAMLQSCNVEVVDI